LITLPLIKRNILAGMVLSFGRAMGEFGATLMLAGNIPGRTQTISMAIYSASESLFFITCPNLSSILP
jgi:molybdate transport system permease protein